MKETATINSFEKKLQKIMGHSLDIICTIDREGRFADVGAAAKTILGYNPAELEGTKFINLIHKEEADRTAETIRRVASGINISFLDSRCVKKDGSVVPVIWTGEWDEDDELMYCVIRDATKIKQQRQKLVDISDRYHYVTKATSDVIWDWDLRTNILHRSKGLENAFGGKENSIFKSVDEWAAHIHRDEKDNIIKKISALMNDPEADQFEISYRYLKSANEYAFVLNRGYFIRNEKGEAVRMIGALQDLTSFKKREERIHLFKTVISDVATDRSLADTELIEALGRVLNISAKTLKIARVNAWIIEDNTMRCIASFEMGKVNRMRGQVLKRKQIPAYFNAIAENRNIVSSKARKDRRLKELIDPYFKKYNIHSLLDTRVQVLGQPKIIVCHETVDEERNWTDEEIAFASAITNQVAQLIADDEKRNKEKELRKSLKEKEVLLAEVHHRVKNNLALISGMMQLQAFEAEDELLEQNLNSFVVRIKSIANLHEQLYKTNDFSKIEFSKSLKALVAQIIDTITQKDIKAAYNISPVQLNINQAIPCSLIVNEVVTNIVKHAFSDKDRGKIEVTLYEDNQKVFLKIKDNGKGLNTKFSAKGESKSLGQDLIQALAKQVGGTFEHRSNGSSTLFSINFKKAQLSGSGSLNLVR